MNIPPLLLTNKLLVEFRLIDFSYCVPRENPYTFTSSLETLESILRIKDQSSLFKASTTESKRIVLAYISKTKTWTSLSGKLPAYLDLCCSTFVCLSMSIFTILPRKAFISLERLLILFSNSSLPTLSCPPIGDSADKICGSTMESIATSIEFSFEIGF